MYSIVVGTMSVNCLLWIERPLLIGPIVQTTELVHAIGTAIAPQIIAPFLSQRNNVTTTPTDSPPLYTTSSGAVVQVVPFTNHSSNTESGILPVQVGCNTLEYLIFLFSWFSQTSSLLNYNSCVRPTTINLNIAAKRS